FASSSEGNEYEPTLLPAGALVKRRGGDELPLLVRGAWQISPRSRAAPTPGNRDRARRQEGRSRARAPSGGQAPAGGSDRAVSWRRTRAAAAPRRRQPPL